MRIVFNTRGFPLSGPMREYAERRLHFALGRFAERIDQVRVSLTDVNGPRGGDDKCIAVTVRTGKAAVRIEELSSDVYAAIDSAAHRAGRTLARHVARLRGHSASRVPRLA